MHRLRFRHLQLVEILGASQSLRKAAAALNMTQPGASKLLRELESDLGVVLFHRTARGVTPTAFGEAFIRTAHLMLSQAKAAADEFRSIESGASYVVRLGMYGVALSAFIADLVDQVRESGPNVLISLEEGSGAGLLSALSRGDMDCVIGRGDPRVERGDLTQLPLFFEPVVLVGRSNHPLAKRKKLALVKAAALEWILPSRNTLLRQRLEAYFAVHHLKMPTCRMESSAYLTNQNLLPLGDQLCIFPQTLARRLAATGALSVLAVSLPLELPPVALWLRGNPPYEPGVAKIVEATKLVAERWLQKK